MAVYYKYDKERRLLVDERSSRIRELVVGIKHIKFNASEIMVLDKIKEIRGKERAILERIIECLGVNQVFLLLQAPVTCLICLYIYWIFNGSLDLTTIFSFTIYVSTLKIPLFDLEKSIGNIISLVISFKRIQMIFNHVDDYFTPEGDSGLRRGALKLSNCSFCWDDPFYEELSKTFQKSLGKGELDEGPTTERMQEVISEADLEIHGAELAYVIGKVGSGKSSLLSAILDLMKTTEGEISRNGSIAYVGQEAFLINDTIKNNILFGKEYDEEKYLRTLEVCQMVPDLKILPARDQTEIGERGINLSGGQKQRISIARAVYSDSDIYLIDDCLSSLDAAVGKAILEEVILGELKNKTRIVVTHFYHYFRNTDRVILLQKG